jgi:hypothetical protein
MRVALCTKECAQSHSHTFGVTQVRAIWVKCPICAGWDAEVGVGHGVCGAGLALGEGEGHFFYG